MADKILSFRIDVQGVSKEAQEIAKLETSLEKLNEERKEAQRLLKSGKSTRKEYESSQHKDWEKCGNCKHGTMIYGEQIEGKVAVQCTIRWRQEGGREEHPSDDFCDNFEIEI